MLRWFKGSGLGNYAKKVHAPDPMHLPGSQSVGKPAYFRDNPQALQQIAEGAVFVALVLLVFVIVAPVYLRTTEQARRRSCRSNLHHAGIALEMYSQDHDGRLPPDGGDLARQLLTYLPERRALLCPSDDLSRPGYTHRRGVVRVPISYTYASPLTTNSDWSLPYHRTPVLWDYNGGVRTGAHRSGGHVLYLDWHTRWLASDWWSAADRPY